MATSRNATGQIGEDAAAAWYEARGYAIVARNWRVREGEIDLIVSRQRELVICEVKTRTSTKFGHATEAVTVSKQARLRRLALMFVAANPQPGRALRFDVAAVRPGAAAPIVEVIESAF